MANLVRDIPDTSSYWAAIWAMCAMPDVHVICDAPVGCYNLLAVAVSNYTDAIPEIENVTPSFIRENEVMGSGTWPIVLKTYEGLRDTGKLVGKQLIVVSTAESEMIGSDLTEFMGQLQPGTKFFHSESLTEDEWQGRERTLVWLWDTYGRDAAQGVTVEPGLVNIIGPTLGDFNAPSDLHEVQRLIEGAGGKVNLIFPYQATLAQITELARGQVNIVLRKEYGAKLAETLGQPWLFAPMGLRGTTDFLLQLGELLGTGDQAKKFIQHEKATTLRAVWDLWKGPQSDWYPTTSVGVVASLTYAEGLKAFLGEELGMPIAFTAARPLRPGDMDNEAMRKQLHKSAPTFLFGSINERIYLGEAGNKSTSFIPASFPGPVVRRSVGTPFMGYRGAVHLVQEIINRLYDALFNVLPVDSAYGQARQPAGQTNGRANGNGYGYGAAPRRTEQKPLTWQPDAKARLDEALSKLHFLTRISASQEMQLAAEAYARDQELSEVTEDVVAAVLATKRG